MSRNIVVTQPDKERVAPRLPATQVDLKKQKVSFSFSDFICKSYKDERFNNQFKRLSDYGKFTAMFINRLSEFSSMTVHELKCGGRSTRCHLIENDNRQLLIEILENLGISHMKIEQIEDFYQLTISAGNGRFMGYFIGNIFYVLLIDPYHLLYPNLKKSANQDLCNAYDPWKELLSDG